MYYVSAPCMSVCRSVLGVSVHTPSSWTCTCCNPIRRALPGSCTYTTSPKIPLHSTVRSLQFPILGHGSYVTLAHCWPPHTFGLVVHEVFATPTMKPSSAPVKCCKLVLHPSGRVLQHPSVELLSHLRWISVWFTNRFDTQFSFDVIVTFPILLGPPATFACHQGFTFKASPALRFALQCSESL